MIVPASNLRPKGSSTGRTLLRSLLLACFLVAAGWSVYVAQQISEVADHDEAQQSDAIAVFGAAEYLGRPSPTFHFRLDHAVDLYRRQIAPMVITLGGGSDRDSGNTEGAVGRDYLLANGIPFGNIIAETHSMDTEQQVQRLVAIARPRGALWYTTPSLTSGLPTSPSPTPRSAAQSNPSELTFDTLI